MQLTESKSVIPLGEGLIEVQTERQRNSTCEEYKEQPANLPKCMDVSQYITFFVLEVLVLHSYQSRQMSIFNRNRTTCF